MKKRSRRERKEDFKKAYYAELQKQGIVDEKKEEKKLGDMTKKELIEVAKNKELDVNDRMTKAEIIELIGE